MSNKTQLPVEVVEEIKQNAETIFDRTMSSETMESIHEAITAYATKLHEAQQENEKLKSEVERTQEVINAAEKVAKIFAHDDGNCAICELAKALQQWKEGKEVGDG